MGDLDEILKEFLIESYENLDQLDRDLVAIESDPTERKTLEAIFRAIHTIKGTSGFFALPKLESVTHAGENLLCGLRDGSLSWNPRITSALLKLVDAIREILGRVESSGVEGDGEYSGLIAMFQRLQAGAGEDATSAETIEAEWIRPSRAISIETVAPVAEPGASESSEVFESPAAPELEESEASPRSKGDRGNAQIAESNVRVDVGLLDALMNLVGELVLARNQVLQHSANSKDANFLATSQRLNLITTQLQQGVMKTRMQPIGTLWNKLPRIARDLASACGKQVRIEMEGKNTELDRTIVEAIKDPLTHILRNMIDHGVEAPEVRAAQGKPARGCLRLRAYHESGQVNIEISDDGGGIDLEKIRRKAVERGLAGVRQAAEMSDRDLIQMIFSPGFSTAEQVTHVSGRGVGMDVVKTNVEKIGGTVDVQSKLGEGTVFKIKIPLTLAIIPALIVSSGSERYAIPQVNLCELVRLEGAQARRGLEMLHGAEVHRLRGRLLPAIELNEVLKQADRPAAGSRNVVNILVLQADDRRFGLVVDAVHDTEEIVVKPLSSHLKEIPIYVGATILGDGKIALILDVMGVAQLHGASADSQEKSRAEAVRAELESKPIETQKHRYLVFELGKGRRMALGLSAISHIAKLPSSAVKRADNQEVVVYRGELVPLLRLSRLFPSESTGASELEDNVRVIFCSEGNRVLALATDRIIDIVESDAIVQPSSKRNGILGAAMIRDHAVDFIDLSSLVREADPTFFGASMEAAS